MNEPCKQWEERLVALLYEDGDDSERAETRAHLSGCVGCRTEFELLGGTRELLSAWPNVKNAPRMVYVNEPAAARGRLRRWLTGLGDGMPRALLAPLAGAAVVAVALIGLVAALDLRVEPDGAIRLGLLASDTTTTEPTDSPVTRAELREGLTEVISYLEGVLESRGDEERRLLLAAIDERMQEQGLSMSQELRGAVNAAFVDLERQHEGDLGLVFSAIDEMGVMASAELQRMNAILGSLATAQPY